MNLNLKQAFSNFFGIEKKSADNSLSIYTPDTSRIGLNLSTRKQITSTDEAYRRHELVFGCVNKLADVMNDAEIIVEKKNAKGEWERVEGHLLTALFKKPNQYETGRDFRRLMVQSEQAQGIFYAELIRSGAGIIVEAYPLNPQRVKPVLNQQKTGIAYYELSVNGSNPKQILPENMLIRRRVDLFNRFFGLSPLAVALKTINSDVGLTEYVDAFFESDGTPSGILKILNATISETKREELQTKWKLKYARGGSNQKGVAVLDQNAEFQKLGANLDELNSENLSDRFESRICSVFGVPPILVGALVGLKHTTANATMKSALNDFWDNKVSPELAVLREWLTWFLLPEFESIDLIRAEKVRVGFDISQAAFLQEDVDKIHARGRENFKAGFWTLNEARNLTGVAPDPEGDYYLQPSNSAPLSPENRALVAVEKVEQPKPPVDPQNANPDDPAAKDTAKSQKNQPELFTGENQPQIIPVGDAQKKTKKSVEYNGLTLAREPRGVELVINLKSLVDDFASEKQKATNILIKFRNELINEAAAEIDKLSTETAYTLTLSPNTKTRKQIEKVLLSAYKQGRKQIIAELNAQKAAKNISRLLETKDDFNDDDFEDAGELTDITISKIINEIQARAVNWYVSLKTLGSYTLDLLKEKLSGESTKFIEQQAGNSVNASIRAGRVDEIENTSAEWHTLEYSAILDVNTCDPCEEADGQTAESIDDLPDAPNPDCEGGDRCRCFIVAIGD